ncbi:MAG: mannose-6-phosphate isomerase, class I [Bacteroidota bacterium]
MSELYRLKGQVKHYDWGGFSFIPDLLQVNNADQKPFAEYWMGVHIQGPAELIDEKGTVSSLIDKAPQLSFLLKLLDVRNMLSIQVHPNKEMAEADFKRENDLGIPIDSPARNYKDPNHKTELMIALSAFWLLHGFRSSDSLSQIFQQHPFLQPLKSEWEISGYAGLYKWVMELPQSIVNEILEEPLHSLTKNYEAGILHRSDPCFWAARAHKLFSKDGAIDRGIFSIFLFNLVELKRGQGIFQGAGVPHAYLEGQNVEIMANSDNVLRGGLTSKHIDVPELLRHVRPESVLPNILDPLEDAGGFRSYPAPTADFSIRSIQLDAGQSCSIYIPRSCILLVPEGSLRVTGGGISLTVGSPAPSAYLPAGEPIELQALEPALLFIASAGDKQAG